MKIRTDVSDQVYLKGYERAPQRAPSKVSESMRSDRLVDPQVLQSITSRLNKEKVLGDALTIAQMSQNVLQKAMIASLQLKSLAMQAVTSGKINTEELASTVSQINSSLGDYGTTIAPPVTTPIQQNPEVPKMPPIEQEIVAVKRIADDFQRGKIPEDGSIDQTIGNIKNKTDTYNYLAGVVADSMNRISREYATENSLNYRSLAGASAEMIIQNPGASLATQGNIRHGIVSMLSS
jgi:hypothetical protein